MMVEQTDAEFIAEIKALAEKATKEPWDHVICDDNWQFVGCSGDIVCHQDPNHSKLGEGARSIDEMDQCNFAFIAAARSAINRLIKMVEDRERERDDARKKAGRLRAALTPLFSKEARELLADTAEAEREVGSAIVAGAIIIALEKDAKARAALGKD